MPQVSLVVQVRVMVLLQFEPVDVSSKVTGLDPSQSSVAVTFGDAVTSPTHCTLTVASGSPVNAGGLLSMRVR